MEDEDKIANGGRFAAVFENRLGRVEGYRHRVEVTTKLPIFERPYRRSPKEMEIERAEIRRLLDEGAIRPARTPWGFPNVLVAIRS